MLAKDSLMNRSTASARKSACEMIFGELLKAEQEDIGNADLEQAYRRFLMTCDPAISVETLETYKTRAASAVREMKKWRADPDAYLAAARAKRTRLPESLIPKTTLAQSLLAASSNTLPPVPVCLREGVVVQLVGVPIDLTKQEVLRILKVLEAYAE